MNKKLVLIAGVVLLASSMSAFVYLKNENRADDLFSANVEALVDNEYDYSDGYPFTTICGVAIGKTRRCKVIVITCQGGGAGCNARPCPVHG